MVTWKLLGEKMPTTDEEWITEFNKYKQYPEFKMQVTTHHLPRAFVAGLDAGLVYNSFPKMADKWIPDDIVALQPKSSNITENPTTVQFNHRILGTTTLTLISALWLMSRKRILPPRAYTATAAFGIMAWIQVILGISTLLTYVPVSLAASHQAGSLMTLSTAVWLTHELKRSPK
ncbi:cytochrome c oxidase assembly protein cox15 [Holotrichia oblita]|uniref:Cytochrome c oxidase assembly protein cox15 n=1 Tax=Holotrichia oblita TaxID=644536 RepID=A0ACB9T8U8_HOLOL|nr:cytochrome c oxidase assembly protein cox15 [Holotrichia oblita]